MIKPCRVQADFQSRLQREMWELLGKERDSRRLKADSGQQTGGSVPHIVDSRRFWQTLDSGQKQ
jgi:hypothetical protein